MLMMVIYAQIACVINAGLLLWRRGDVRPRSVRCVHHVKWCKEEKSPLSRRTSTRAVQSLRRHQKNVTVCAEWWPWLKKLLYDKQDEERMAETYMVLLWQQRWRKDDAEIQMFENMLCKCVVFFLLKPSYTVANWTEWVKKYQGTAREASTVSTTILTSTVSTTILRSTD